MLALINECLTSAGEWPHNGAAMLGSRRSVLVVAVLSVLVAATTIWLYPRESGTPERIPPAIHADPTTVPSIPFAAPVTPVWRKADQGDEQTLGALPVTTCPLDAAGCVAAGSILRGIETGDHSQLFPAIRPQSGGPLIPSKQGLQIDDADALSMALNTARQDIKMAIGCPQATFVGPEPGACDDLFVLAVDISLGHGPTDRRSLAFLFVREDDAFLLTDLRIQPYFDISHGGLSMNLSLPYSLMPVGLALWFTPWTL
jgi:hypothetical protein